MSRRRIRAAAPSRNGRRCSISAATSTEPASRIHSSRRSTKSSRWAAARRCRPPFISTSSRARSASRLRHGEHAESEFLGAVNSGDPETLEQFLLWAFDACPARRYVLVMAGLGIMDSDSVVGRPPFDAARLFAICDDRATNDAIELHELSATLRAAFPPDGAAASGDACLRHVRDAVHGSGLRAARGARPAARDPARRPRRRRRRSPTGPTRAASGAGRSSSATPADGRGAAVAIGRGPAGADARERIRGPSRRALRAHARTRPAGHGVRHQPARRSCPLAQALDTFSVVYLQWLSNDVIWRAREIVVKDHTKTLEQSWSYDLSEVAMAIVAALKVARAKRSSGGPPTPSRACRIRRCRGRCA